MQGAGMSTVPSIFGDRRRRARRARAVMRQRSPDPARWLIEAMAEDVTERLAFLRWQGQAALFSGLGSELVAAQLGLPAPGDALDFAQPIAGGPYDAIVTLGELDTVNDLPGALINLRRALAPAGLLIAVITGAGSLPRLRAALLAGDGDRPAARIHPQVDSRAASGLLARAGFARQVVDEHVLTVRYPGMERLIGDLRDQGQTGVLLDRAPALGKAARDLARSAFAAQADADGKVSERFALLTLTAWQG